MQHKIRLISFAFTLTLAPFGCTDKKPPDEFGYTKEQTDSKSSQSPAIENDAPSRNVTFHATLTTLNDNFAWFDNSDSGHEDGVSPLASFQIKDPNSDVGRVVNILFKYGANDGITAPLTENDLGKQFSFDLPEGILTEDVASVDNLTVRNLRQLQP